MLLMLLMLMLVGCLVLCALVAVSVVRGESFVDSLGVEWLELASLVVWEVVFFVSVILVSAVSRVVLLMLMSALMLMGDLVSLMLLMLGVVVVFGVEV